MVEDMTKNLVKVPKSIAISFEEMPFFVRGGRRRHLVVWGGGLSLRL